jgi:hypothetical protein
MRLYLDMCCLMRPFDDDSDPRMANEAEIVLSVLESVQFGEHVLIVASAHRVENGRNPNTMKREFMLRVMSHTSEFIENSDVANRRAFEWQSRGIGVLDS